MGGVEAAEGAAGLGGAGRGGQRGRGAMERLQDHCNIYEGREVDFGVRDVETIAECQLRPEGRAPMFSIERTRRGIEKVYRVFGLTECEILVRFTRLDRCTAICS